MAGEVRTRAVTAKAINYGESDLVVTLVTESEGVVKAIAKGAAKSLKRFSGCFEPFTGIEVTYRPGRGDALGRIGSADVLSARAGIRSGLDRIEAGAVMLELAARIPVPTEESSAAYGLLSSVLDQLAVSPEPETLLAGYWLRHLVLAGYGIGLGVCSDCGSDTGEVIYYRGGAGCVCGRCSGSSTVELSRGLAGFIGYVDKSDASSLGRLRLTRMVREEAIGFLKGCTRALTDVSPRTLKPVTGGR